MRSWAVVVVWLLLCVVNAHVQEKEEEEAVDPDAGLDVMGMIRQRGYSSVQQHQVQTDDGFLLTMYRIPQSYRECRRKDPLPPQQAKPVVYLIHGLLDSSFTWVLNYRHQSLAFLLADQGYDVWLGNNRGTTWSQNHIKFSKGDAGFWDFTFEDMAKFDMPAMLNYILDHTGRPTLSYVGHSEGTMQAFAGLSENQELAKKISFFGALAPVTYIGHQRSPIFTALAKLKLDKILIPLGLKEFGQYTDLIQGLLGKFGCSFAPSACGNIVNLFTGPSKNINNTRLHVYISQTPAGTSAKNMAHFAQGVRQHTFAKYDYGCHCLLPLSLCPNWHCKNKAYYGAKKPPAWDLGKLKYPRVGFYIGSDDWLATPTDLNKAREEIPKESIIFNREVKYNHLDFTWAYNAREKIYDHLIEKIKHYEGKQYP